MSDKKKKNKKINLKKEAKSGLAKFTQRPLPDEMEVSDFEKSINKEIREDEIENNLSEIYQDKKGNMVDVRNKSFKKNKSWLLIILKNLLFLLVLAVGAYLAYMYYTDNYLSVTEAKIEIEAPENIQAGEEFSYIISYHNPSSVEIKNISLQLNLPSNFVLLESSKEAELVNYWVLEDLLPNQTKELKLTGKLYNRVNSPNLIKANLSYMPANFSSQFSTEDSANTIISGLGFNIESNYFSTALVSQENEINLRFLDFADNNLSQLILELSLNDNLSIEDFSLNIDNDNDLDIEIEEVGNNLWKLSNLPSEHSRLDIDFIFKALEKLDDSERITLNLYKPEINESNPLIYQENLDIEIMQSDLSLSLEINDNRSDQSINFGDELNYVLTYDNRGQATLTDVVLMVIIEGEMIDWTSLEDKNSGRVFDSVIVYAKEEVKDLEELSPGQRGEIEFSLKTKEAHELSYASDLAINSWAQFSFNFDNEDDITRDEDNRSNAIEKLINSDLKLNEQIRYFDENNIPVGSGPLPPEVGEETSVRVYWTLENSLHDLEDIEVSLELPSYVSWSHRLQSTIGDLEYLEDENRIVWTIDELELSNYRADAEFNLSFTPSLDDRDKILVISPGSRVTAKDKVTGGKIEFKSSPQTSQLKDDDIAAWTNNGRVQ